VPRSDFTIQKCIDVSAGVIDADYRGPVSVVLFNFGIDDFVVKQGDYIVQIVMEKSFMVETMEVEVLTDPAKNATNYHDINDTNKKKENNESRLENLCDDLIININQYFLNPIDSIRFSLCNKRIRSILPYKPPLQIKILGMNHNELSLNANGDDFNAFFVSEVPSAEVTAPYVTYDQYLKVGIHYYFWVVHNSEVNPSDISRRRKKNTRKRENKKGPETKLFLGRGQRTTKETPSMHPHYSCRFNLDLTECSNSANNKRGNDEQKELLFSPQTWTIFMDERNKESLGTVDWNVPVGLSIGGVNTDQFAPDNTNRRVLTTRPGDWNVVVSWWQAHEVAFLQKV